MKTKDVIKKKKKKGDLTKQELARFGSKLNESDYDTHAILQRAIEAAVKMGIKAERVGNAGAVSQRRIDNLVNRTLSELNNG